MRIETRVADFWAQVFVRRIAEAAEQDCSKVLADVGALASELLAALE